MPSTSHIVSHALLVYWALLVSSVLLAPNSQQLQPSLDRVLLTNTVFIWLIVLIVCSLVAIACVSDRFAYPVSVIIWLHFL